MMPDALEHFWAEVSHWIFKTQRFSRNIEVPVNYTALDNAAREVRKWSPRTYELPANYTAVGNVLLKAFSNKKRVFLDFHFNANV